MVFMINKHFYVVCVVMCGGNAVEAKISVRCPECLSKQTYYRRQIDDYVCRICGYAGSRGEFVSPVHQTV